MKANLRATSLIVCSLALVAVLACTILEYLETESFALRPSQARNPGSDVADPAEALLSDNEILRLTESLTQHYDEVGKYWTGVLDDEQGAGMQLEHVPDKQRGFAMNQRRVFATKVLGQMKYRPAIPVLIKHIRFRDITVTAISDSGEGFVAQEALGQYGNAVVPEIMDAYLDDSDRNLLLHFLAAIHEGCTEKAAKTYLLGLHAQHDHRVIDEDFLYFP